MRQVEDNHRYSGLKREGAELAGGRLSIWSQRDSGTEIELTIPAAIAFLKSSRTSPSMTAGEGNG